MQLALEDDDFRWELVRGRLYEKPGGTVEHNSVMSALAFSFADLHEAGFHIRTNAGYTRRGERKFEQTYLCPDAMVVPGEYAEALRGTMRLESYARPLPFVAEV